MLIGIAPQSIAGCDHFGSPVTFTSVAFIRGWTISTVNDNTDESTEVHPNCAQNQQGNSGKYCQEKSLVIGSSIVEHLIRGVKPQVEAAELIKSCVRQKRTFVLMKAVKIASEKNLLEELGYAFTLADRLGTNMEKAAKALDRLVTLLKEQTPSAPEPLPIYIPPGKCG